MYLHRLIHPFGNQPRLIPVLLGFLETLKHLFTDFNGFQSGYILHITDVGQPREWQSVGSAAGGT